MDSSNTDLIVADIGGTNARFAIARCGATGQGISLRAIRDYRNAGLVAFDDVFALYLDDLDDLDEAAPPHACFGIAGPVQSGHGRITNLGWVLDTGQLQQRFGISDVMLVNDFEALAWMLPQLPVGATTAVIDAPAPPAGPRSVIGPGTGFGVSLVVESGRERVVVSTECGHMSFAPCTRMERDLKAFLEPMLGHVSVESLLSGAGLVRIHDFLIEYAGSGSSVANPADITAAALDGSQPSCARAVQVFLSIMGSVAGDIALAHGATGGIFLGGGVLPRIAALIPASNFRERFVDKGPMRYYLARIPVRLITEPYIALQGVASIYLSRRRSGS